MESRETIFSTIFQRNLKDAGTSEWLEDVIARYPAFAPALFFKLQEGKWNHQTQLLDQCQVLFPSAYWLQYLLKLHPEPQPTGTGTNLQHEESLMASESIDIHTTEPLAYEAELTSGSTAAQSEIESPGILALEESVEATEAINADDGSKMEAIEQVNDEEAAEKDPGEIELPVPEEGGVAGIAGLLKPDAIMPDADLPLFEPLHTTDYFASQGIKISDEVLAADRLGHQLKSFTQWLKAMKKLHPNQMAQAGEGADTNIQQLAEASNTADDILTEAMAHILIQQGRTDKAIEVYEKLSLQNPAKSVFFATQIENLKAQ